MTSRGPGRIDVPGAVFTRAFGINSRDDIVGASTGQQGRFGFLLHQGSFTAIDEPDAGFQGTEARGINDQGDIVGAY